MNESCAGGFSDTASHTNHLRIDLKNNISTNSLYRVIDIIHANVANADKLFVRNSDVNHKNKILFYNSLVGPYASQRDINFDGQINKILLFIIDSLTNLNNNSVANDIDKEEIFKSIRVLVVIVKYQKSLILHYPFSSIKMSMIILSQLPRLENKFRTILCDLVEIFTLPETPIPGILHSHPHLKLSNIPKYFEKHSVILLLGPPQIGKSTLGQHLVDEKVAEEFIDIELKLKNRGDLDYFKRLPTNSRKEAEHEFALELLNDSLDKYLRSDGNRPLIITFVKESKDAYAYLTAVRNASSDNNIKDRCNIIFWYLQNDVSLCRNEKQIMQILRPTGCLYVLNKTYGSRGLYYWNLQSEYPLAITWPHLENRYIQRKKILNTVKEMLVVQEMAPTVPNYFNWDPILFSWLSYPGRYTMTGLRNIFLIHCKGWRVLAHR